MYEQSEKYKVNYIPGKGVEVLGHWKDDMHDIRTRMLIDYYTYTIMEAEVTGPVTPFGEVCQIGLDNMDKMVGVQVGPGFNKIVKQNLMGKSGCTHLGEMVINSFKAGLQAASRIVPDWVEEDDYSNRWSNWAILFKDSCIYFSQPDALHNLQDRVQNGDGPKRQEDSTD
ncbi:Protein of unknown function DUF2889 [Syntrophomonas zehnderi OL-4]|uniref:DUF2889 domain-containing protein n=1 Tax=Syntrophomonas zehnderi OL-4 TaxID=690567 RepID=A0A0E4C9D8_9FIRM|nr:DUF2889 domain-containing protein [Syntrophomonas zehnderi]CFX94370.1 Protein of unknown function DUF2889 [Syntrophomonas zehnderi OL-4]